MSNYFNLKNESIFNPPAGTDLGNSTSKFGNVFLSDTLNLGNTSVTGTTLLSPRIASITYPGDDTAASTAGGQTITLSGAGFATGASILINGSAVGVVTVVDSETITFTSPAVSAGSYVLYVINSDGGTGIAIPGIQYSGTPTWSSPAAGSLGSVYEQASISQSFVATGDAPISYSVYSGSLPTGVTLNSSTGALTGTAPATTSSTTYSFTIRVTDNEQQDTDRAFSITINPDVVTWSSPSAGATISGAIGTSSSTTLSATSAAGRSITYSANALPSGLTLSSNTISGTPTTGGNTSVLLTATAATTGRSATRTITYNIASSPVGQVAYTTAGSYSWTAPAGVTSVCVVCVGGGGGGRAASSAVDTSANGGDSYFINTSTVMGGGGKQNLPNWSTGAVPQGGTYVGDGGGNGGTSLSNLYGGSGAGGYSGNGGIGATGSASPTAGSGGGGGGGNWFTGSAVSPYACGGGGGTGILGQVSNGSAAAAAGGGGGGSGGGTGGFSTGTSTSGGQGGRKTTDGTTSTDGATGPGSSVTGGAGGTSGGGTGGGAGSGSFAGGGGGGGAFGGGGGCGGEGSRGGAGGGLGWKNNITVVPGQSYTVVVGAGGTAGNSGGPGAGGGGGSGAVRIIWGTGRAFPSTNTGDM